MPAVLALLAAACGAAEATPVPLAPAASPHPALAIVERLAAPSAAALPDVVGQDAAAARAALTAAGADVQLVALADSATVTAQYPAARTALPPDRTVVVWLGEPPEPPPVPPRARAEAGPPAPAVVERRPVAIRPPASTATSSPAAPSTNIRTVAAPDAGRVLQGLASWYGPGFAGRQTACGAVFDPSELTLASRELRCGTRVRVTGASGATVDATVTDWGPATWTGRRFDLSAATFAAIHHPGAGVVHVSVEVLG